MSIRHQYSDTRVNQVALVTVLSSFGVYNFRCSFSSKTDIETWNKKYQYVSTAKQKLVFYTGKISKNFMIEIIYLTRIKRFLITLLYSIFGT